MSINEIIFLWIVAAAFGGFGLTLAVLSWRR